MMLSIIIVAVIGLTVSIYSHFVKNKLKADATYKPFCDLSDIVSCSKPINSKYGMLFLLSNTTIGMLYYISIIALALFDYAYLSFFLSAAGVCASIALAYILYWKIRALCLLCTSIYIINILLLIITYKNL